MNTARFLQTGLNCLSQFETHSLISRFCLASRHEGVLTMKWKRIELVHGIKNKEPFHFRVSPAWVQNRRREAKTSELLQIGLYHVHYWIIQTIKVYFRQLSLFWCSSAAQLNCQYGKLFLHFIFWIFGESKATFLRLSFRRYWPTTIQVV